MIDLFGCGDSDGEHSEARWNTWCDDLAAAARWLGGERTRVVLCGFGFGGLLAAGAAAECPLFERLVLVKPVVDGRSFVRRLFIAHSLDPAPTASGGARPELCGREDVLEVMGYQIHSQLISEMERTSLLAFRPQFPIAIEWIETGADDTGRAADQVTRVWKEWDRWGIRFRHRLVSLPAPWEHLPKRDFHRLRKLLVQTISDMSP